MIYISDSETGVLHRIDCTVNELKASIKKEVYDGDVSAEGSDWWEVFQYNSGWTIHNETNDCTISELIG